MICWRGTANRRATPVTTTQYVLRATPCPFDRQRHHSRCVSGTPGDFIPAISLASNCLIAAKPLAGGAPGHDDSLEADVQRSLLPACTSRVRLFTGAELHLIEVWDTVEI